MYRAGEKILHNHLFPFTTDLNRKSSPQYIFCGLKLSDSSLPETEIEFDSLFTDSFAAGSEIEYKTSLDCLRAQFIYSKMMNKLRKLEDFCFRACTISLTNREHKKRSYGMW